MLSSWRRSSGTPRSKVYNVAASMPVGHMCTPWSPWPSSSNRSLASAIRRPRFSDPSQDSLISAATRSLIVLVLWGTSQITALPLTRSSTASKLLGSSGSKAITVFLRTTSLDSISRTRPTLSASCVWYPSRASCTPAMKACFSLRLAMRSFSASDDSLSWLLLAIKGRTILAASSSLLISSRSSSNRSSCDSVAARRNTLWSCSSMS
mmetsp:Transcript_43842/g.83716  ORF Transcript_43842/g.83716 Transcript_43842/m.83716 type:complete len:208 (-) Transcript_43842:1804-2427(-)